MPVTVIIAGAAALSVVLIAFGLATAGTGGITLERLERYAATGRAAVPGQKSDGIAELLAQSATFAQFNKAVEKRDFGANLLRDLGAADLKLKPSEFLAIWAATIVGVPVAMFFIGFAFNSLQNPLVLLFGAFLGFLLPRFWLARRKSSRLNAFNKQLPDTVTLIANALRAGSSFLQAIELVVREARPPITTEFNRVIREVNLGLPFDTALDNMVRRVKSEDFELMATAIAIQHQVGGNLAEILDSIAFTIRERVRIKGEIRTLTAQQRLSGYVVAGLPIGLGGILFVIAPTFFAPMFDKPPAVLGIPFGVILLAIGGTAMFIGFQVIRKIVDIEV
jgi:tight adherence protein B